MTIWPPHEPEQISDEEIDEWLAEIEAEADRLVTLEREERE